MDEVERVEPKVDPIVHADEVVARADKLQDRISEETEKVISELVSYKQEASRQQRITWGVLALVIFAIFFIRANTASNRATCVALNRQNANEITLWQKVLDFPPDPNTPETPQQKANRAAFEKLLLDTFKQRDCPKWGIWP